MALVCGRCNQTVDSRGERIVESGQTHLGCINVDFVMTPPMREVELCVSVVDLNGQALVVIKQPGSVTVNGHHTTKIEMTAKEAVAITKQLTQLIEEHGWNGGDV